MKTNVPLLKMDHYLLLVLITLFLVFQENPRTYTTISNGAWNSASTWQGGVIPNASNIPAAAVINIRHMVTYSGPDIKNNGIINIKNQTGLAPRLVVAAGVNFQNNPPVNFT